MSATWSLQPDFLLFTAFAAATALGAIGVALSRSIIYSAMYLLLSLLGTVGLFALLAAPFLAVVQLLVYVGGILVLILFAIMLTEKPGDRRQSNPRSRIFLGLLCTLAMTAATAKLIPDFGGAELNTAMPDAKVMGNALVGRYVPLFELAGFVLLIALIAAVVIVRKNQRTDLGRP